METKKERDFISLKTTAEISGLSNLKLSGAQHFLVDTGILLDYYLYIDSRYLPYQIIFLCGYLPGGGGEHCSP